MTAPSPAWESFWSDARAVKIEDVAQRLCGARGITLKREGVDLTSACPAGCASTNGFVVTPKKGLFLCRPSGATGGAVEMVMHGQSQTNVEAAEWILGRDRPDRSADETDEQRQARAERQEKQEREAKARKARDEKAAARKKRKDEEAVADVVARALPIAGTHAEAYLKARGIVAPRRLLGDVKFIPDLDYWGYEAGAGADDNKAHIATIPAMIAFIRDVDGEIIGVHETFLNPREPVKWIADHETALAKNQRRNPSKKIRGKKEGGMIRLGRLDENLAIAEGIENALSWFLLGQSPEDISLATSVDLYNMGGGCTGTTNHPTVVGRDGKPARYPNGVPDPAKPGCALPEYVKSVILLGDGDSEPLMTRGRVLAGGRRYRAEGRAVFIHFSPAPFDWNEILISAAVQDATN